MASFNIRNPALPTNSIIIDPTSSTLPAGFSHVSCLFDKYPKGIPNLCTQPGGTLGAHTHSEACTGPSHNHTGTNTHTHTITLNAGSGANNVNTSGCSPARRCHTHSFSSGSASQTQTVCANTFAHTHDTQTTEPTNRTTRFIKKVSGSIRAPHLPFCKVIWYAKAIACKPSHYSIESTLTDSRFLKGVPNACTAPGTTAGTNCHQHSSNGNHTHSFSLPSHTHTQSGSTSCSASSYGSGPTGVNMASKGHTHTVSGITTGSASDSGTTASNGAHQHTGLSHIPLHRELLPIKLTKIFMRQRTLPIGSIVLWICNLSTIPGGWQVANGTNGTVCTLDRYARPVPNACTNPGTGAGAASHQHAGQTHTHPNPFTHTHTVSGSSGAGCGTVSRTCQTPFQTITNTHTHGSASPSGAGTGNTLASGCHQHTSVNNDPAAVRVAYIQRI